VDPKISQERKDQFYKAQNVVSCIWSWKCGGAVERRKCGEKAEKRGLRHEVVLSTGALEVEPSIVYLASTRVYASRVIECECEEGGAGRNVAGRGQTCLAE
jgi:hypothetical protein